MIHLTEAITKAYEDLKKQGNFNGSEANHLFAFQSKG